jgi:hypothetical protein
MRFFASIKALFTVFSDVTVPLNLGVMASRRKNNARAGLYGVSLHFI